MKRDTQIVVAVSAALIVAVATIGWWFGSLEGMRKLGQAVMLLTGVILAVEQCRRFPRRSPMMLCGAILGLGFPFLVASAGPAVTTVLTVSVACVWMGIGIARTQPPSRTDLRRTRA